MIDYPLAIDTWDEKEINAINRVIKSNRFTMDNEVKNFENEFATYFNSHFATMVNSGSSANLIAITALIISNEYDLNPGDEVIVPAVSWSTTFTVLHQCGLKLRFVDVELDTLNINIEQLEYAITKDTKALFAVNLLGNPNNFKILTKICEKYNLILIEDNCESMGAKFNNKYTGTFGIVGTFSTYFSHHMGTMEGGSILTSDPDLNDIMKSIRSHGWTRNLSKNSKFYTPQEDFYEKFNFIFPGYNVRPIEIEAAIGREQLKKLDKFLENRKNNAQYFKELFSNFEQIQIQKNIGESSNFGFSMIFENKTIRQKIINLFNEENIECRPIVAGNFTKNPVIKYFDYSIYDDLKNANKIHDCGLFIGNHHEDIKNKLNQIYKLLNKNL